MGLGGSCRGADPGCDDHVVVLLLSAPRMRFKTVVSLSHTPKSLANFILAVRQSVCASFLIQMLFCFRRDVFSMQDAAIIITWADPRRLHCLGVHPVAFAII